MILFNIDQLEISERLPELRHLVLNFFNLGLCDKRYHWRLQKLDVLTFKTLKNLIKNENLLYMW